MDHEETWWTIRDLIRQRTDRLARRQSGRDQVLDDMVSRSTHRMLDELLGSDDDDL